VSRAQATGMPFRGNPEGIGLLSDNTPRSPEAQLLILCARSTVSNRDRMRMAEILRQNVRWPVVLDLIQFHGVGPLVSHNLQGCEAKRVPGDLLETLSQQAQAVKLVNHALLGELLRLCRAFESQGVQVVPFKGPVLAVMAYRDLSLRDMDDLDFFVPRSHLAEAERVLWSQGYRPRRQVSNRVQGTEAGYCFVKKDSMLRVDLQSKLDDERLPFRFDRRGFWKQLAPIGLNGSYVRGMAPEQLLVALCMHGAVRAWSRLKWVVDVAELLKRQRLDWRRVFAAAAEWKSRRMLLLGLALAHRMMEAPLPHDVRWDLQHDPDVPVLAPRMPATLLLRRSEAVDEVQVSAMLLSLQDSRWNRWSYSVALARANHPILVRPPGWCRFDGTLRWASRLVEALRRPAVVRVPVKSLIQTIDRIRASAR